MNRVIVDHFDVAALGRYNLFIAVVLIGGQLGSGSLHSSVLYHTPEARSLGQPTGQILVSALLLTLTTSVLTTSLVFAVVELIFSLSPNFEYHQGLRAVIPALFLYPINKTLLSHLNGMRKIRSFSIVFAGRFAILAFLATVVVAQDWSERMLPWSISAAEFLIFLILVVRLRSEMNGSGRRVTLSNRYKRHVRFGIRGLIGGLLLDLNTRVDVVLLALLVGSRSVGVYSIASLFAESLFQLAMVARYSYDPVVTSLFVEGRTSDLRQTIRTARRRIYLLMAAPLLMANLAYPFVVDLFFGGELVKESWPVFAVLSVGIGLSAGYIPFTNLLQQIDSPGRQSLLLGSTALTNILLNLLLIPFLGVMGAALGTAISQICLVPYLRLLSKPILGFSP